MILFNCNICGLRGFNNKQDLNEHIKYHRLLCQFCNLVFYRENNLNFHINHVHLRIPWIPPQFGGGHENITHRDEYFDIIKRRTRINRIGLTENGYSIRFKNL